MKVETHQNQDRKSLKFKVKCQLSDLGNIAGMWSSLKELGNAKMGLSFSPFLSLSLTHYLHHSCPVCVLLVLFVLVVFGVAGLWNAFKALANAEIVVPALFLSSHTFSSSRLCCCCCLIVLVLVVLAIAGLWNTFKELGTVKIAVPSLSLSASLSHYRHLCAPSVVLLLLFFFFFMYCSFVEPVQGAGKRQIGGGGTRS